MVQKKRSDTYKLLTTKELFGKAVLRFENNNSLISDLRKQSTDWLTKLRKIKYYHNSLKQSHKYKLQASFFCFFLPPARREKEAKRIHFLPLASAAYQSQSVPNALLCADLKLAPLHQRNRHLEKQSKQMIYCIICYSFSLFTNIAFSVQACLCKVPYSYSLGSVRTNRQMYAYRPTQLSKCFKCLTQSLQLFSLEQITCPHTIKT